MTWVCLACGNHDTFRGTADYSICGTRSYDVSFDRDGEIREHHDIDNEDIEDDDLEESSVDECSECASSNLDEMGTDAFETWEEEHFEDGIYYKDGVCDEDGEPIKTKKKTKSKIEDKDGNLW